MPSTAADDGKVGRLVQHARDKGTVDLHLVEGKTLQVAERGKSGAEVVQRDQNAQSLQFLENPGGNQLVEENGGFGYFQDQAGWLKPGFQRGHCAASPRCWRSGTGLARHSPRSGYLVAGRRPAGRPVRWPSCQASVISPASSAIGMNCAGGSSPRLGGSTASALHSPPLFRCRPGQSADSRVPAGLPGWRAEFQLQFLARSHVGPQFEIENAEAVPARRLLPGTWQDRRCPGVPPRRWPESGNMDTPTLPPTSGRGP